MSSSRVRYWTSELATTRSMVAGGSTLDASRIQDLDIRDRRHTLRQPLAQPVGRLAQHEPPAMGGNVGGVERLAAAVVEHDRVRRRDVADQSRPTARACSCLCRSLT